MLMFDNDALIKFGAWDLIEKSIQALDVSWETCRRLESIRYMLPSLRAKFVSSISDEQFDYIIDMVARIPVLSEEIDVDLANELLEISDIDPGEAALFSGMLSVNTAELLTGDKRALSAFATAADSSYIERIKGRCHCVESQLLALIEVFDFEAVVACLRNAIDVVASPVIIGPVAMLGFLDTGGTDEGQAIYRRTNNTDFTRGRRRAFGGGCMPQAQLRGAIVLSLEKEVRWHGSLGGKAAAGA